MSSKKKTGVTLSPRRNGLSKAARELLARVRVAASPEVIFGLEPAMAAAKVQSVVGPMIEGAGLPVALLQEYRWYVGELCRLMRTMSGPDLAYCMERAIRKWLSLGLEPNTVVFLAGALFDRLKPETRDPDHVTTDEHGWTQIGVSPRKHEGHEKGSESGTGTPALSDRGRRGQPADPGTLPSSDDERRTMDEETTRGGGP